MAVEYVVFPFLYFICLIYITYIFLEIHISNKFTWSSKPLIGLCSCLNFFKNYFPFYRIEMVSLIMCYLK